MDWLLLIWAVFVSVVAIGGTIDPLAIGQYTSNFSAVYAVILVIGVCVCVLRLRAIQKPPQS